jgi:hypothetical protein
MPKKGLSYNSPPKRAPAPADVRALGNGRIMDLIRKEWAKRMDTMRNWAGREGGGRKRKGTGRKG